MGGDSTTEDFGQVSYLLDSAPPMDGTPLGFVHDLVGNGKLMEHFSNAVDGVSNLAGESPWIVFGMALLAGGFVWKVAQNPGGFFMNLLKMGVVVVSLTIAANVVTRWSKGEDLGNAVHNTIKQMTDLLPALEEKDAPDTGRDRAEKGMLDIHSDKPLSGAFTTKESAPASDAAAPAQEPSDDSAVTGESPSLSSPPFTAL